MIDFGPWLPDHLSLGHPSTLHMQSAFPAVLGYYGGGGGSAYTSNAVSNVGGSRGYNSGQGSITITRV